MVAAPRWLPTTGWDGDGDRGGREHPQPTALLPLRLSLLRQKERGGYVGENGLSKPLRTPAARAPVPPYGRSAAVGSPPSFSAVTQPGDAASAAEIQRTPLRSATRAPCRAVPCCPAAPPVGCRRGRSAPPGPQRSPQPEPRGPAGPLERGRPRQRRPRLRAALRRRGGGRRSGAGGGAGRPRPPPLPVPVPGPGTPRPGGGPRTERAAGRSVSGAGPRPGEAGTTAGGAGAGRSGGEGAARGIRRECRRRTAGGRRRGPRGSGMRGWCRFAAGGGFWVLLAGEVPFPARVLRRVPAWLYVALVCTWRVGGGARRGAGLPPGLLGPLGGAGREAGSPGAGLSGCLCCCLCASRNAVAPLCHATAVLGPRVIPAARPARGPHLKGCRRCLSPFRPRLWAVITAAEGAVGSRLCRCLSRCPPLDFTRVCLQTEAVPSPLRTSRPPAWQRCCIGACNAEISLTQRVLSSRKSHLCLAELFGVGLLCLFVGSFFFLFCRIFFFPLTAFLPSPEPTCAPAFSPL